MSRLNDDPLWLAIVERLRELDLKVRVGGTSAVLVTIPTADGDIELPVEIKDVDGKIGLVTASRLRRTSPTTMLAQRHISTGMGRIYRSWGLPYVDSGGNMSLTLPGYVVRVEGRKPLLDQRAGRDRPSRADTVAGLRVVFTLLVRPDAVSAPLRTIAERAGVSLGAAQGAVADLVEQGAIHTSVKTGSRALSDPQRLAKHWITGYADRLRPKLDELRLEGPDPGWWADRSPLPASLSASLSGESAMASLGYPIRPTTTTFYGTPPWGEIRTYARLRSTQSVNVILRERFWSDQAPTGQSMAPSLLVYADAITSGDPRLVATADQMWGEDADLRGLRDRG